MGTRHEHPLNCMHDSAVPKPALEILHMLEDAGGEAWFVGGIVRDWLCERRVHDIDIATSLLWKDVRDAALAAGFAVHETGTAHGTVTIVANGLPVEVTTYRTDGTYTDSRHPDEVKFGVSLEEDLARRDFTMNALAWHPERGLIDAYDGLNDIDEGVIRAIGDPTRRFSEDALRILRACRFLSQLGFSIEPSTYQAMLSQKSLLGKVAKERVYHELEGFVCGAHVHDALMKTIDVLAFVLPELVALKDCPQVTPYHRYDVLEHTAYVMQNTPQLPLVRWTALFHDMGKPAAAFFEGDVEHFYGHAHVSEDIARGIMHRLPFPAPLRRDIPQLVLRHDDVVPAETRAVRRALNRLGGRCDLFEALCDIKRADALAQAPQCAPRAQLAEELRALLYKIQEEDAAFTVKQLAIDGHDVLSLGMPEGPAVGKMLQAVLDAVIDERVPNDRDALLAFMTKLAETTSTG